MPQQSNIPIIYYPCKIPDARSGSNVLPPLPISLLVCNAQTLNQALPSPKADPKIAVFKKNCVLSFLYGTGWERSAIDHLTVAMATDTTVHSPQTAFSNVQRGHWEVSPEEIELGPKIGEGANAVIMKAKFRQQNCVAKMLKSGVSGNTQAYKDLIMELEILTSVTAHPNVVQFMGACIQTPEKPVVLEEYVDGPTLENFLQARRGKKLEKRTIYGWSLDLLRALDFLHNRNPIIIHRDLKPANILLTRDLGSLKLTDFGMSKKVDRAVRDTKQHKGYTGTVRYMAPEVISCQTGNYTEKCDIYSASLILWYIATCQRPPPNDINKVNERPTVTWIAWPSYESLVTSMWAHAPEEVRISLEAYLTVIHVPS